MDGGKQHVVVNDNGLEAAVQDDGEDSVLETSDEHRLIAELVLRPAKLPKLLPQIRSTSTDERD